MYVSSCLHVVTGRCTGGDGEAGILPGVHEVCRQAAGSAREEKVWICGNCEWLLWKVNLRSGCMWEFLWMCGGANMQVCIHAYVCVSLHMCGLFLRVCEHVCMFVCEFMCEWVSVCVCVCVYVSVCLCVHAWVWVDFQWLEYLSRQCLSVYDKQIILCPVIPWNPRQSQLFLSSDEVLVLCAMDVEYFMNGVLCTQCHGCWISYEWCAVYSVPWMLNVLWMVCCVLNAMDAEYPMNGVLCTLCHGCWISYEWCAVYSVPWMLNVLWMVCCVLNAMDAEYPMNGVLCTLCHGCWISYEWCAVYSVPWMLNILWMVCCVLCAMDVDCLMNGVLCWLQLLGYMLSWLSFYHQGNGAVKDAQLVPFCAGQSCLLTCFDCAVVVMCSYVFILLMWMYVCGLFMMRQLFGILMHLFVLFTW